MLSRPTEAHSTAVDGSGPPVCDGCTQESQGITVAAETYIQWHTQAAAVCAAVYTCLWHFGSACLIAYRREMCVVRDSSAVCVNRSSSCRGGSDPVESGATDLRRTTWVLLTAPPCNATHVPVADSCQPNNGFVKVKDVTARRACTDALCKFLAVAAAPRHDHCT